MSYGYLFDISRYAIEDVDLFRQEIKRHFSDGCSLKRRDSVISKKLLCDILKNEYKLQNFSIDISENGKPYLVSCDVEFNISHSADYVFIVTGSSKIGCDIQTVEEYKEKIVKRFFNESEYKLLKKSPDKNLDFTKLWALKESILKYRGDGISGGLDAFDFSQYITDSSFSAYGLYFSVGHNDSFVWAVCSEDENFVMKYNDVK